MIQLKWALKKTDWSWFLLSEAVDYTTHLTENTLGVYVIWHGARVSNWHEMGYVDLHPSVMAVGHGTNIAKGLLDHFNELRSFSKNSGVSLMATWASVDNTEWMSGIGCYLSILLGPHKYDHRYSDAVPIVVHLPFSYRVSLPINEQAFSTVPVDDIIKQKYEFIDYQHHSG